MGRAAREAVVDACLRGESSSRSEGVSLLGGVAVQAAEVRIAVAFECAVAGGAGDREARTLRCATCVSRSGGLTIRRLLSPTVTPRVSMLFTAC